MDWNGKMLFQALVMYQIKKLQYLSKLLTSRETMIHWNKLARTRLHIEHDPLYILIYSLIYKIYGNYK